MDVGAVNTAGGICELAGLGLAVREYLADLQAGGHLAAARRHLELRWQRIVGWWRRVRGRPAEVVYGEAHLGITLGGTATGQVIPGKFAPHAGQEVEEQIAHLGQVVNRVIDWAADEFHRRDQAIGAVRSEAEANLRAESQRIRDLIAKVEGELQDLDQRTRGDLRLRLDGLVLVLVGIVFTTWAPELAQHVLGWLPWPFFYLALIGYVAWRLIGSTTRALHSD